MFYTKAKNGIDCLSKELKKLILSFLPRSIWTTVSRISKEWESAFSTFCFKRPQTIFTKSKIERWNEETFVCLSKTPIVETTKEFIIKERTLLARRKEDLRDYLIGSPDRYLIVFRHGFYEIEFFLLSDEDELCYALGSISLKDVLFLPSVPTKVVCRLVDPSLWM